MIEEAFGHFRGKSDFRELTESDRNMLSDKNPKMINLGFSQLKIVARPKKTVHFHFYLFLVFSGFFKNNQ
jgi:hypothetical protein